MLRVATEVAATNLAPQSNWKQLATVGANATSYTVSGQKNGVTYYFRVSAYTADGDSAWSNTASATARR